MKESALIRTVQMDCPVCGKIHEVEERRQTVTTRIKGEDIEYEETCYICKTGKTYNEFVTGKMSNANLLCARNAYRKKHNLLTSDDIVKIRELYGLSQIELARLMGWGEATISRYESKAIQDESYDNLLKLIRENPLKASEMLDSNKDKFKTERYLEIRNNIVNKLNEYGKEYLSRQALLGDYAGFSCESDSNGLTILNIDKLECAISYLAEKTQPLYKVKLMKLLWYIDALSFKKRKKTVTGLVYCHDEMGALPLGHYKIVNLDNVRVSEEIIEGYDNRTAYRFYENEKLDFSVFDKDEIEIIDCVVDKFRNYSGTEMKEYMHRETAYTETKPNEIIPFSLAKEIRDFERREAK